MEIRETQARLGKCIEMRRRDLTSECSYVRKPQIVGNDHQKIGSLVRHRSHCRFFDCLSALTLT